MDDGGDAHLEHAAVLGVGGRRGDGPPFGRHVLHGLPHDLDDALDGLLARGGEPTQARELGAEADELFVLVGPEHAVGILVGRIELRHVATSWASSSRVWPPSRATGPARPAVRAGDRWLR